MLISPDGGKTTLQALFYALPPVPPYQSPLPTFVGVKYREVNHSSLDIDMSYPTVRFTVKLGGEFTARAISETLNWTTGPPKRMIFYEEVVGNLVNPLIIPVGGAVFLVGIAISILGVRTPEKHAVEKRKKSSVAR
jgi:hypothetical protein